MAAINNPDIQKWIKLSFLEKDILLFVEYEDGWGNKASGPINGRPSIDLYFENALKAFPYERQTREGIIPIPLAVYLEDGGLSQQNKRYLPLVLIRLFEQFFGQFSKNSPLQVVVLQRNSQETAAFSLPLNIRFSGRGAKAMKGLIHSQYWNFYDQEDEKFGIRATTGSLLQAPGKRDILVLKDKQADVFFENPKLSSPRFIIFVIPHKEQSQKWRQIQKLSIPCLCIGYFSFEPVSGFLRDFIYSIIHDFSLHESLYYSLQKKPDRPDGVFDAVLFASPESNQSVRMRTALESYKARVYDLGKSLTPGNLETFISKFTNPSHAAIKNALSSIAPLQTAQGTIFDRAKSLDMVFHGESTGLVPLANEERQFYKSLPSLKQIRTKLSSVVGQPEAFLILRENQERKVDIALDAFSPSLVYQPVSNLYSLRAGGQYRLNVTIGQLSPYSLMSGDIPSIDPLLPDPKGAKGHELDVVVYPKDFALTSPARLQVYLPLLGGTAPLQFQLSVPLGIKFAELRVVVFYHNHLLQSFLLSAEVEPESNWHREPVVKVVLDLCTTLKFTNLDVLKPRALYMGMNAGGNGTHSIFLKKDKITKEIDGLTEAVIGNAQERSRTLLEKAYFTDDKKIRFPTDAQPGEVLTEPFYEEIRNFSKFGSSLYKEIYNQSGDEMKIELEKFQTCDGEDIQIGRHSMNYAFPWPMIYDYPMPRIVFGGADAPVCMGQPFMEGQYDKSWSKKGYGCKHNPDVECYCLEGFWGIRHRIEQIFNNDKASDFTEEVTVKSKSRLFYSRNISDNASDLLTEKLQQYVSEVFTVDTKSNLMELLWDDGSRPPALVVLGHLETTNKDKEPEGPRIITFPRRAWTENAQIPAEKWIYGDILLEYCTRRKRWNNQPLPLVMLISCESADLSITTLNSIVKGFHSAGASAIIGTECLIATGLGARFVDEILEALYKKDKCLGEAIRLFNKRLFASGVPLPFVFTCYGNMSLKMIQQPNPPSL
jgi:hypothetical protein